MPRAHHSPLRASMSVSALLDSCVNELRLLILELDANVRDEARSSTWPSVRTFFVAGSETIGVGGSAARAADCLRDLEAGFLITAQTDEWLENGRTEWLDIVRSLSRVESALASFSCVRLFGNLLKELGGSLLHEAFEPAFVARDRERVISAKTSWHLRIDALTSPLPELSSLRRVEAFNDGTDSIVRAYRHQRCSRRNRAELGLVHVDRDSTQSSDNVEHDSDDPYHDEIEALRNEVERFRIKAELAESAVNDTLCAICYTAKRDTIVAPCLHMLYCSKCITRVRECQGDNATCPHCRVKISGMMRVFV